MTLALWILAAAIVLLAAVIFGCFLAWEAGAGNRFGEYADDEDRAAAQLGYFVRSNRNGAHYAETDE